MNKILVVEDDKSILETITEVLQNHNYDVVTSTNGLEALEKIKESIPDVILSDVMMPKINGFELKEVLKKNENLNSIPFIFLTAKSNIEDFRQGMNLGADDYITKPFKAKELVEVVKLRLEKSNIINKRLQEIVQNIDLYVPHEFRTPLNSILGYSELLMFEWQSMEEKELKEIYHSINKSAKRLSSVLEKLALLQSFGNCKSKYETEIDYPGKREIVSSAMNVLMDYERTLDIALDVQEAKLEFNTNLLKFVIEQLLDNACKFSDYGSKIFIISEIINDEYILSIVDRGIGITKKQISNINAFVQFNKTESQQIGNGLGLYLSKKIIEHFGGRIEIESEINSYTEVRIYFKYK